MLLFDEHLSPKLCRNLAVEFPGSVHVHEVGLGNVDDRKIWEFAREKGLIIVTIDSDFPDLQGARGFPPRVVWICSGNRTTAQIENILRGHHKNIEDLASSREVGLLIIR